jgi:hypothetical protein
MCDIALGRQEHGLQEFAARVNAFHMSQWVERGLYDEEEIEGSWGQAFELALTRTLAAGGRFHFNLDGLDIADALVGDPQVWVHGHTAWELRQIVRNRAWFDNTLFYRDGKLLTPEEVLARGIVIHSEAH